VSTTIDHDGLCAHADVVLRCGVNLEEGQKLLLRGSVDHSDLIAALADKYFHLPCSVMTRNDRRLESLRQLAEFYRPECVIDLIWQACLTYDVESHRVKHFVEAELGLPYLRIETDYSPSDSARIAVRVEALFETIRVA